MNRKLLLTAVPFAAVSDGLLLFRVISGYGDPTLYTIMGLSFVIGFGIIVKALLPEKVEAYHPTETSDSSADYEEECDEDSCDDCDSDWEDSEDEEDDETPAPVYTAEELASAKDEANQRGFEDGVRQGQNTAELYTEDAVAAALGDREEQKITMAGNPSTRSFVLNILARDKSADVRALVAKHPKTPMHTLERLAKDDDGYVVWSAYINPNTTDEMRAEIRRHSGSKSIF